MSTPLDFAVDVLMLKRGRFLCADTIALFGLPPTAPYFCSEWVGFLFEAVPPEFLSRFPDLLQLFLYRINECVGEQRAAEMHSAGWSKIAGMRRLAYEHVGHGILASPADPPDCPTFHDVLRRMGACMNLASHVRQYMDTPGPGYLGHCLALGEALSSLCAEHRLACRSACLREGRGAVSRHAPANMLCEPRPSPFFCGDGQYDCGAFWKPYQQAVAAAYEGPAAALALPLCQAYEGPAAALSLPAEPAFDGSYSLFKGHFDPLLDNAHVHRPAGPRAAPGEHGGPADTGIRPWAGGEGHGQDERPAPVLVRDEGGQECPAAWHGDCDPRVGTYASGGGHRCGLQCHPGELGAVGEPVLPRAGRRGARWAVAGSLADASAAHENRGLQGSHFDPACLPGSHFDPACLPGSHFDPAGAQGPPVAALSPWAPQGDGGDRGQGICALDPQVGQRRRREADDDGDSPGRWREPPCVAWRGGAT